MSDDTRTIYIPFIMDTLLDALEQLNVSNKPEDSLLCYSECAYIKFNYLSLLEVLRNYKILPLDS